MSEVLAEHAAASHSLGGVSDGRSSYAVTESRGGMFATAELRVAVERHLGGGTPSRSVAAYWNGGIPWASVKDFDDNEIEMASTQETISPAGLSASASNLIPTGTPLVCTRMAVGRVAITTVPMAINQDVKALYPAQGVAARHLLRLLHYVKPKAEAISVGSTVKGVRVNDYLSILVPQAPTDEQPLIARVLDTLDIAIRQTEAIITKLKQVKQGLLHDLLTRGIDANGELRPLQSEAPHLYKQSPLGWIPNEWDSHQLRDLATLITSGSRGWATHYVDVGALFVRSQNVRMGSLDFADRQHVAPPPGSEGQRTRLEGCDLLITITGNSVGNVAHVPENWQEIAFVSQHVGLVRLYDPSLSLLAAHYLVQGAPGSQQLIDAQYGQSKPGLNLENLRNLRVPCPSTEERMAVVERIACVDMRIETEERYLAKLCEFKQGIMDDLLTGRVRVTSLLEAAAAPMPP